MLSMLVRISINYGEDIKSERIEIVEMAEMKDHKRILLDTSK